MANRLSIRYRRIFLGAGIFIAVSCTSGAGATERDSASTLTPATPPLSLAEFRVAPTLEARPTSTRVPLTVEVRPSPTATAASEPVARQGNFPDIMTEAAISGIGSVPSSGAGPTGNDLEPTRVAVPSPTLGPGADAPPPASPTPGVLSATPTPPSALQPTTTASAATPTVTPPPPVLTPTVPEPTLTATPGVDSPLPTATVKPKRSPTATSNPVSGVRDDRYGLIVGGRNNPDAGYFVEELGASWYLDYGPGGSVSQSTSKLRTIMLEPGIHPIPIQSLNDMIAEEPGAYYQIGNEPNVNSHEYHEPRGYAVALQYYVENIKGVDPTAVFVGPNVLNFDFTCIGCGGYQSGHLWIDEMRSEYIGLYGEEPPIDIWGIHFYPIDWTQFPTTRVELIQRDLLAFRQYLDELGSNAPIWITEFGLHWGFEGIQFVDADGEPCDGSGCLPSPSGEYLEDSVADYLNSALTFFEAVSDDWNLDRWFIYRDFFGFGPNPSWTNGLTLFESHLPGAELSNIGRLYQDRMFGRN